MEKNNVTEFPTYHLMEISETSFNEIVKKLEENGTEWKYTGTHKKWGKVVIFGTIAFYCRKAYDF